MTEEIEDELEQLEQKATQAKANVIYIYIYISGSNTLGILYRGTGNSRAGFGCQN